jgi:hypothetical protein
MTRPTRLGLVLLALAARGCSAPPTASTPPPSAPLQPGEVCDPSLAGPVHIRFDPPIVVVAQGQVRPVRLIVDPDMCVPTTATMTVSDPAIAQAPSSAPLDLRHPTFDFDVLGIATGQAAVAVSVQRPPQGPADAQWPGDPTPATASLPVVVNDGALPACDSPASPGPMSNLSASSPTLAGSGDAADASLSVPPGAFTRTDELALPAFGAAIGCAHDLSGSAPAKPRKLGPAISFTPQDPTFGTRSLRREIDFAIPVNPAAMPTGARMRHLQVLYEGPRARTPRPIPVANPRFDRLANGHWVLRFSSPWFGTYQAAVAADAGTRRFKRHLTHRAVVGFSMGAGGAASFGLRHHDQFDVIAPMGGPSDWTWLLWFVENYALGGFCPASQASCPATPPNEYPLQETYAHTEDFNHWWYQDGGGNGGRFARGDYIQIFEDLALMQGNPNGQNADPALSFFPAGPSASDAFVKGTVPNVDCSVFIDPVSPSPDDTPAQQMQEQQAQMQQQQIWNECVQSRCDLAHTWTSPKPYYDATYNPDGSHPVITFCDGPPQNQADDPYEDTWADVYQGTTMPASAMPVDMALAVDLNGNGKRDADEPVIRQGHEPWQDTGTDGVPDAQEPGYDPVANPDPNQDDYDFQLNPGGTEGDHRYETGEPYEDVGLDGVPGTPQQPAGYDVGEGDGRFTMATGLQSFYANDPHSMIAGWSTPPAGALDDDALARIDVWSDGGVRELVNVAAVANHLEGAIAARRRPDGTPVKTTAFYNNFEYLPGEDPKQPDQFQAADILWADVADAPSLRYGTVDATAAQILQGDGQHVGTGTQILDRLVTSFYFAASKWPDADRTVSDKLISDPSDPGFNGETTTINELGTACELKQPQGHCETYFTGPRTGRTGPIAVTLPPGYALEANRLRDVRYPVLYVLHGYGQDPRDLEATAAITDNYMNDQTRSSADRLAKMIVVYVDGRCRIDPQTHTPECIRGTFYLNGNRTVNGRPIARIDDWFDEVVDYIDKNYRTLPPTDIDVVE